MVGARLGGLTRTGPGRALSRRLDGNLRARRLARRLGVWSPEVRAHPPDAPVGVKLELTHRCNLKCPFCYTDSPRHTRARTPDLSDAEWQAIVEDAVAAGVVEAVVTGGEPLLRGELALVLLARLAAAGVGTTMNTNGWFVDDTTADRLAEINGLQVNVSVDGATRELHDGARGAPGSWDRALAAADRLLARDVRVRLLHVVTPANLAYLEEMLEHAWLLGVGSMRVTGVGIVGAAARGGTWTVRTDDVRAAVGRFRGRRGVTMPVSVITAPGTSLASLEDVAPASLLIRPNGAVLIDSLTPFRFGTVPLESLATCWERVVSSWPHPEVVAWARSIASADGVGRSAHVPYRDPEVELVPSAAAVPGTRPVADGDIPSAAPPAPASVDLDAARAAVVGLALSRRYGLGAVRATGSGASGRYVRVAETRCTHRLNETAALVMDACVDGTTPADAVGVIARRHPALPLSDVEADVLASVRSLVARRIVVPVPR